MNKTIMLAVITVLAAAATLIGSTFVAPAAAFTIIQKNRQTAEQSGFVNLADQDASNCIAVLNTGGNACRIP
jgi:hypothetical protein